MAQRTPIQTSRWKAMVAAIAVTAIVGAGILSGLNVDTVSRVVDHLRTFDISLPQPPPEEPPPKPQPKPAKPKQAAPAAPKASPVPKPEVELPAKQPVPASEQPGTGSSASAGQGGVGTGTGTGGSGAGSGGGGGNTPARLVRNLSRSDYRRLTGGRMPAGAAGLAIRVSASGRVDSCSVEYSSGDSAIDAGLCPLVRARLRFQPARNAQGQPIPFYTHYRATWRR